MSEDLKNAIRERDECTNPQIRAALNDLVKAITDYEQSVVERERYQAERTNWTGKYLGSF